MHRQLFLLNFNFSTGFSTLDVGLHFFLKEKANFDDSNFTGNRKDIASRSSPSQDKFLIKRQKLNQKTSREYK
jgi:hypothetical protein